MRHNTEMERYVWIQARRDAAQPPHERVRGSGGCALHAAARTLAHRARVGLDAHGVVRAL